MSDSFWMSFFSFLGVVFVAWMQQRQRKATKDLEHYTHQRTHDMLDKFSTVGNEAAGARIQAEKAAVKGDQNAAKLEAIHDDMNGKLAELIAVKEELARLAGVQQERAAEQARQDKDKEP